MAIQSIQGIQGTQGTQVDQGYTGGGGPSERHLTLEEALRIILSIDPLVVTGSKSTFDFDNNSQQTTNYIKSKTGSTQSIQGIQSLQGTQTVDGFDDHTVKSGDRSIPIPLMLELSDQSVILDKLVPAIIKVLQCIIEKLNKCCDKVDCPETKKKKAHAGGKGCTGHMCESIHPGVSCYCETFVDDPMCIENPMYIPENCEDYNEE